MASLTRRGFLLVSAAAIVAPALPAPILAAAPVAPILTPVTTVLTPLPAWAVGPEDSFGWLATRAATLEEAIEIYRVENDYADTDDHISLDAVRIEAWDYMPFPPRSCDWIIAGLGSHCDRCGEETFASYGAIVMGELVICDECLTPEEKELDEMGLLPGRVPDIRQGELFEERANA